MSEHLLIFPERTTAEEVADDLDGEGFTEVRVIREPLAGEDDAEDHDWAVYIREDNIADDTGAAAQGLRDRFAALAADRDGWYDPNPHGGDTTDSE